MESIKLARKKALKKGESKVENGSLDGVRVLWNFNAVMVFLFLLIFFLFDFSVFFGFVLEGLFAKILHLIYLVAFLAILFGLTFHKAWVYNFILWAYYYWTANMFLTLLFSHAITNAKVQSYLLFSSPIILLLIAINLVIFWFLFEKRDNFPSFMGISDIVDKVFRSAVSFFYLCFIFFMVFIITKSVMIPISEDYFEMKSASPGSGFGYSDENSVYNSIFYLLNAREYSNEFICLKIDDAFYRFLCLSMEETYG